MKCDIDMCDRMLSNKRKLWLHKVFNHNQTDGAFICEICPKKKWRAFSTKIVYDKHMKEIHSEIDQMECNICGKKYGNMRSLNLHISISHENKGPWNK